VIFAYVCFCLTPFATANAQTRKIATPNAIYEGGDQFLDKFFRDWIVAFYLPENSYSIVAYTTSTGTESCVFGYSRTFIDPPKNGKKLVKVVAGYTARWQCNYKKSVFDWGNTIRVRYYQ